jgi:TusE/DsrC/DsvC family sulfur relay protein
VAKIDSNSITYEVDDDGFLTDFDQWDENFATSAARKCGMGADLTDSHWQVIYWIRQHVVEFGVCPMADSTCHANDLHLQDLRELFPSGYLRGACRIAGIPYAEAVRGPVSLPAWARRSEPAVAPERREDVGGVGRKTYTVDVDGFLVHPEEWDEEYAAHRASEMKMPTLTARHWRVIRYLRNQFREAGSVPTIYRACEELAITLGELDELFPDGYHGGAVKIAGLRAATSRNASPQQ